MTYALKIFFILLTPLLLKTETQNDEMKSYELIQSIDGIEIRQYPESVFASYYNSTNKSNHFSELAQYIFGGNEERQWIEMTSPVSQNMYGNEEMLFLMPDKVTIENHPTPNNKNIQIIQTATRLTASIGFSGYANDQICNRKKLELIDILTNNSIPFKNDFQTLIYDPPYKRSGRLNEIIVSIKI